MAGFNDTDGLAPNVPTINTSDLSPGGFFAEAGGVSAADRSSEASAADARYWAELAKEYAEEAEAADEDAQQQAAAAEISADEAAASATSAANSATAAANSAAEADSDADRAKSWAVGPSGEGVDGTDTDNARYWAMQAMGHDSDVTQIARQAQGWAVGDTDGPLTGWSETNNSKYYSEQSATSAAAADSDANRADSEANNAAQSAMDAATSATNAAASAASADSDRILAQAAAAAADSDAMAASMSAASADSDAMAAQASAEQAATSATEAAASAMSADSEATLAKSWAVGPSGTGDAGTDTDNAHYWALQAMNAATKIDPQDLRDSDEFYYQPVVTDSDTQGVTMAVGIRRRWNTSTNSVETDFRSVDRAHRITADGEHDTYHGVNELGHDVEARHSWNMDVLNNVAQKIFLFSEEHGGFSLLEPTDPTVKVDLDSEGTHTNYPIYNMTSRLIDNGAIDTDFIADTEWVKNYIGEHPSGITKYFHVNSTLADARAEGGDAIAIGPNSRAEGGSSVSIAHGGGAYGDNSIFIGSQDADGGGVDPSAHRGVAIGYGALVAGNATDGIAIGPSTDANSGHHYSIAIGHGAQTTESNQIVLGGDTESQSITRIRTPHFRSSGGGSEYVTVDTDGNWGKTAGPISYAAGFGIDNTQFGSNVIAVDTDVIADTEWVKTHVNENGGYKGRVNLDYLDTDGNMLTVDTEKVAGWIRANENTFVSGTGNIVQIQHQFRGEAENSVWHLSTTRGIEYSVNVAGQTVDIDVDTETIADTEWVKEYVATHGGGGQPGHVDVNVAFNSSAVSVGDDIDRNATVTVTNGTFTSISNANASQGTATITGNTVNLDVNNATEGTVRLTFTVHYTDMDGTAYSHNESFSITVRAKWYAGLSATQPTAVTDLTDEGAFVAGDTVTYDNTDGTETLPAYAFIPTDDVNSAMFETTQGFLVPFTQPGVTSGDHTLIQLAGSGVDPGISNTFRVKEV